MGRFATRFRTHWMLDNMYVFYLGDSVLFTVRFLLTMFFDESEQNDFRCHRPIIDADASSFQYGTLYRLSQTQLPLSSFNKPDAWLALHGWPFIPSASTHGRGIQLLDLACITLVHVYSVSFTADGPCPSLSTPSSL